MLSKRLRPFNPIPTDLPTSTFRNILANLVINNALLDNKQRQDATSFLIFDN